MNRTGDLPAFVEVLKTLPQHPQLEVRELFDGALPVVVSRAPGRLDVMGGIADYSGSLVLQRPIAEATFAALQLQTRPIIRMVSLSSEASLPMRSYAVSLESLSPD